MIGQIDRRQGDEDAAAERLDHAAAIGRRVLAPMGPRLESSALGRWLAEQMRRAEALPLLHRARDVHDLQTQPDSEHVAETAVRLDRCE